MKCMKNPSWRLKTPTSVWNVHNRKPTVQNHQTVSFWHKRFPYCSSMCCLSLDQRAKIANKPNYGHVSEQIYSPNIRTKQYDRHQKTCVFDFQHNILGLNSSRNKKKTNQQQKPTTKTNHRKKKKKKKKKKKNFTPPRFSKENRFKRPPLASTSRNQEDLKADLEIRGFAQSFSRVFSSFYFSGCPFFS